MRSRVILITAALVAVTAVTTAATEAAGSASAQSQTSVLTLLAPAGGTSTSIDLGKRGISPGDEFVTTNAPLRRPQSHVRAGRIDLIETAMGATRSSLSFTAQLPHGTLQVLGVYNPNNTRFTLPIVGGTGTYLGARGAVTLDSGASTPTLTFRLLAGPS
jgi:hypothetical protein